MSTGIKGPGVLWVTSRIASSAKDTLDEETFLKWYDEVHIAEVIETSGIKDAFRYVNLKKGSPAAPIPFLAFYPMVDLAFTQSQEFKNISVKSDILPDAGVVYDMVDFDVRYLGLVGKTEAKAKKEPAQYIVVSAIEPAEDASDDEVNRFYNEQTATASESQNYLRTVCFRLLYAHTNAQSSALKGHPTTDEPAPGPPTWQAVHEFSAEPAADVKHNMKGDSNSVLKKAKQNELHVYKLATTHGGKKLFE